MNIWITGEAGFNIATWPMLWIRSPLNWEHHQPCVRGEACNGKDCVSARTGLYKVAMIKEITIPVRLRLMTGRIAFFLTGDIEAPLNKRCCRYWQQNAGNITSGTSPWQ